MIEKTRQTDMSNFQTTPTRIGARPNIPHLPATPESQVLSSPIATNFSSPTPSYWGTPAGSRLWPPVTSAYLQQPQNASIIESNSNILDSKSENNRNRSSSQDSGKRGRPRADVISHLILEGTSSPNGIKCRVCNRVFPREKSLQVITIK